MINMKHYLKLIISAGLLGVAMTSCLEETFPTDGATSGQLESADKSAFNAAIASYMNNMSLYGDGGDASDAGFSSFIIWRDAMTADFAIVNTTFVASPVQTSFSSIPQSAFDMLNVFES